MAGFLNNTIDAIKSQFSDGVFSKKNQSVLGVDISSAAIKVVQLKNKGGRVLLETYGEISLGPYNGKSVGQAVHLTVDKATEAMNDVLDEADVTSDQCGVSIPMSSSLTSFVDVPDVEENKLNDIIPIEARKHIPVPISEVYLDWHIIPQEESELTNQKSPGANKVEALIVAIHKESIAKYQTIIEKSNLEASFFEIEVFSTIRSSLDRGIEPVMVVDFGVSSTKIYIVEHGLVRGSHVVNRGAQDITSSIAKSLGITFSEAEKLKRDVGINHENDADEGEAIRESSSTALKFIFSKAQRVLLDFERKQNKSVTKTVLTGGGSLLHGLHEMANEQLDTEVVRADPFNKVRSPAFLDEVLTEAGPEFAVALGAALRRIEEIA